MTFEEFITNNEDWINKITQRYTIKNYPFEDLKQEGLMKLWEVFDKYDDAYAQTTFINTVLSNHYHNLSVEQTTQSRQNYDCLGNMLSDIKDYNFDTVQDSIQDTVQDIYNEQVLDIALEMIGDEKYGYGFIQLLYGETYESVGNMYGVSKQNIAQRFQEYLEKVRLVVENKL